jgi:hypothetical protein
MISFSNITVIDESQYFFQVNINFEALLNSETLELPHQMNLKKSRTIYPGTENAWAVTFTVKKTNKLFYDCVVRK